VRGRDRHRGAELLDRHLLDVVGDRAAAGPGQVVGKERVLEAARAVQRHVAEALAKRGDPALQFLAVRGADRERERGPQHRRVRRGLQDRLVLTGEQLLAARLLFLAAVAVAHLESGEDLW